MPRTKPTNMRKGWTPAEIEQLRQMATAGISARVIARTLGRTLAAVQSRASAEGISNARRSGSLNLMKSRELVEGAGHLWSDG